MERKESQIPLLIASQGKWYFCPTHHFSQTVKALELSIKEQLQCHKTWNWKVDNLGKIAVWSPGWGCSIRTKFRIPAERLYWVAPCFSLIAQQKAKQKRFVLIFAHLAALMETIPARFLLYQGTSLFCPAKGGLIKTMPSQLSETVIEEEMTDLWLSLRHQQPPLYHSTLVLISRGFAQDHF